jgi:protoheme IX farnesyltransferase
MKEAVVESIGVVPVAEKSWAAVFSELIKARLTFLVLLTTAVGFYLGMRGAMDWWLFLHALASTALLASGASALNQLLERNHDKHMRRTEDRPLPSGRMQPNTVLIFGALSISAGLIYMAAAVNLLTSLLGALTVCSYVFVYTPLKRVTTLNTVVGAIPGALPPLMGWTAARDALTAEGWALFAILFFWQLPHFFAIAWIYRDEYAKAGFVMLPIIDPEGHRTSRQAVSHTLGLLPISLCPVVFGMVGAVYLMGALLLGLAFIFCAIRFSRELSLASARSLFYASILYLPLLLVLMVVDKVKV